MVAVAELDSGVQNEHSEPVEQEARNEQSELSALEAAVLAVEQRWWQVGSTKEAAIRELTGMSEGKYYLLLSALLDQPKFWRADPVLVDRLRRLRYQKLAERTGEVVDN